MGLFCKRRQHTRWSECLPFAFQSGAELARQELALGILEIDEDTIVVPVPDTAKAAADAMAHASWAFHRSRD